MVDNQLKYTISEAFSKANVPQEVFIGLAFMKITKKGLKQESFFKDVIEPLVGNPQVSLKVFETGEYEPSVGFGRKQALSMYNNQDYILQIDSHTKFEKGWDTELIRMYEEAFKETNNEKTILTAYLPAYEHDSSDTRSYYGRPKVAKYPFFMPEFRFAGGLPSWRDTSLSEGPFKVYAPYVPCVKFNAQFAFSNRHFYEDSGLPETVLFWEEELIQTMNLLDSGFSLVFPNQVIPLAHLYSNDVSKNLKDFSFRVQGTDAKNVSGNDYSAEVRRSYLDFITAPENRAKVDKFFKYTKTHPVYGPYLDRFIPPTYNR